MLSGSQETPIFSSKRHRRPKYDIVRSLLRKVSRTLNPGEMGSEYIHSKSKVIAMNDLVDRAEWKSKFNLNRSQGLFYIRISLGRDCHQLTIISILLPWYSELVLSAIRRYPKRLLPQRLSSWRNISLGLGPPHGLPGG